MLSCIMTVRGGKEMRIGEVSKLTNVSMRSLRYYEEKGLIHPERLENGYRDYDKLTLERIKTLKLYFDFNFSLISKWL